MNDRPLVLYHGPSCADGFTAAFVAWLRLGETADYLPVQYGDPPPDVAGRHVWVLDFSWKRAVLLEMMERCRSLVLLDHHQTAAEELAGLEGVRPVSWLYKRGDEVVGEEVCSHVIHFDQNKSGARLAWEFFFPGQDAPWIVRYVEDRDLWKWELYCSRQINAALGSLDFTFANWQEQTALRPGLHPMLGYVDPNPSLIAQGVGILRYQAKQVASIVRAARDYCFADGSGGHHQIKIVNTPILQSEVAGELAKGRPFGAVYWDQGRKRIWSLRSEEGGLDVSQIAKSRGGGGHRHAAGFEEKQ